ncbi:tyrosine 3-monooxygenase [Galendromus occidentalis]|uniref:Tyrosine 3-monooxygenase n=1 Tax=Galendromus occidentalis TaxID=34638 RepID=A0AAJ7SG64_9ACAR|nr:tyrosine 3-monooxygenase [Galendromus occidentalis]
MNSALSRARFAIKSYSVDQGYPSRRRSLVDDAKFETQKKRELSMVLNESIEVPAGLELINEVFSGDLPKTDARPSTHVVVTLKKGVEGLGQVLNLVETHRGHVAHLETRQPQAGCVHYEAFLTLEMQRLDLLEFTKSLTLEGLGDLRIVKEISAAGAGDIWFPSHITDLDFCTHVLTKFEPDLDSDHPGFNDIAYRARRKKIAEVAFDYKEGQLIPDADYTPDEVKTWGIVYTEVKRLAPTHSCAEFNRGLEILEQEVGYGPHAIPQLQAVSDFLKRKSGFRLRPASGLLTARDFLASLAFRVFQCTQYVRHPSNPDHSPEPDCIHELIGHIPMFANPQFAEFSQDIGLASLGVSDEDIEKLATLYWFTVEFGLCKEGSNIRAYGAGLLSSIGEIQHALSSKPSVLPFDPETTAVQKYQDQDYQPTYFLAESFLDVQAKFRDYVQKNIRRPFSILYDPYINSVIILTSPQEVCKAIDKLQSQISALYLAMQDFIFTKGFMKTIQID